MVQKGTLERIREDPRRGAKEKQKILRRALKGHLKTKKEGKEKWHKRAMEKKRKPGYFSWKEEATEVCLNFLFLLFYVTNYFNFRSEST